jgi:hypothetical protein
MSSYYEQNELIKTNISNNTKKYCVFEMVKTIFNQTKSFYYLKANYGYPGANRHTNVSMYHGLLFF